jgi:phage N-6-adenine-methyltransferase
MRLVVEGSALVGWIGGLTVNGQRMGAHYSSRTDLWSTPQDLFDRLNANFGFTLDVCALPENAKCERFFSPEDDGLAQEWTGVCWMNPPYGREIGKWLRKANEAVSQGATVVALIPARTDTRWWHDYVRHHEIEFLAGRLRFGTSKNSAPFPSAVVVMKPPAVQVQAQDSANETGARSRMTRTLPPFPAALD